MGVIFMKLSHDQNPQVSTGGGVGKHSPQWSQCGGDTKLCVVWARDRVGEEERKKECVL